MEAPYDSPFWAIEGEVIPEVANFKEEGLVTHIIKAPISPTLH